MLPKEKSARREDRYNPTILPPVFRRPGRRHRRGRLAFSTAANVTVAERGRAQTCRRRRSEGERTLGVATRTFGGRQGVL